VLIERPDGEKTELQGYSEKAIERFLQKRIEDQQARDAQAEHRFKNEHESE
jgi:hypothetical protein